MDFLGLYECSVDPKNRIIFPMVWRKKLEINELIITEIPEEHGCILFPKTYWNELPREEKDHFKLWLNLEFKKVNGRLLLPQTMINYFLAPEGGLSIIVLQGREDRIFLWEKKRWEEYLKRDLPKLQSAVG